MGEERGWGRKGERSHGQRGEGDNRTSRECKKSKGQNELRRNELEREVKKGVK